MLWVMLVACGQEAEPDLETVTRTVVVEDTETPAIDTAPDTDTDVATDTGTLDTGDTATGPVCGEGPGYISAEVTQEYIVSEPINAALVNLDGVGEVCSVSCSGAWTVPHVVRLSTPCDAGAPLPVTLTEPLQVCVEILDPGPGDQWSECELVVTGHSQPVRFRVGWRD